MLIPNKPAYWLNQNEGDNVMKVFLQCSLQLHVVEEVILVKNRTEQYTIADKVSSKLWISLVFE